MKACCAVSMRNVYMLMTNRGNVCVMRDIKETDRIVLVRDYPVCKSCVFQSLVS